MENKEELEEIKEKEKYNKKKEKANEELPINDELFLSPIQKYRIYNKFPFKLIIHFSLVIVTSFQIYLLVSTQTKYTRAQEREFYELFISEEDKTSFDFLRSKYLYSLPDLRAHLNKSIDNFYHYPSHSFEDIYFYPGTIQYPNIEIEVSYLKNVKNSTHKFVFPVNLNNETSEKEGISLSNINQEFIKNLTKIEIDYSYIILVPYYYADYLTCFNWKIKQEYSFASRGHMVVSLIIARDSCDSEIKNNVGLKEDIMFHFSANFIWLHILVFTLAIASAVLTLKYFFNMFKVYWKVKKQLSSLSETELNNIGFEAVRSSKKLIKKIKGYQQKDDSESMKIKAKSNSFFNIWSIVSLFGNVIQCFGSGFFIVGTSIMEEEAELLIAFGCLFAYLNFGKYLQNKKKIGIIYLTISKAIPNTMGIFFSSLPIFMGFVFFGICVFWKCERFGTLSDTIRSLFSMMNGDVMFDVLADLKRGSYYMGQIFGYCFCILFVVVVMNVFLSVIGEAYVVSKMANHNHWIYSYIKLADKKEEVEERDRSEDSEEEWRKYIREQMKNIGEFIEIHEELNDKLDKMIEEERNKKKNKNKNRDIDGHRHEHKNKTKGRKLKISKDKNEKRNINIIENFRVYLTKNMNLLEGFLASISNKVN